MTEQDKKDIIKGARVERVGLYIMIVLILIASLGTLGRVKRMEENQNKPCTQAAVTK